MQIVVNHELFQFRGAVDEAAQNQAEFLTHIVVENRGKREDFALELEFRRVCDGNNFEGVKLPFEIVFADKKTNRLAYNWQILWQGR